MISQAAYPEWLEHQGSRWCVRLTAQELVVRVEDQPGGVVRYRRANDGPRRVSPASEDWPRLLPARLQASMAVLGWVTDAWDQVVVGQRQVRLQRELRETRVLRMRRALQALASCAMTDDLAALRESARCYRDAVQSCLDHGDPVPGLEDTWR